MKHNDTKDTKEHNEDRINETSRWIVQSAFEVHQALGPGLLESSYESALCRELELQGVPFQRQVAVPIIYKDMTLDIAYRLDLLVNGCVIVEIKALSRLEPIHEVQVLTYLRHTGLWLGLLINFHSPRVRDGIRRIVNGLPPS